MTKNYQVIFDEGAKTFIVRIFGKAVEQDIIECFKEYEEIVDQHFNQRKFGVIINVTEEAHSSMLVLKMIRGFLENQKHREFIGAIAAVNELQEKVAARNSYPASARMPFFVNEEAAREYTSGRLNQLIP